MFLPERMKELRLQQNLTQAMIAAKLHITRESYCQYEKGRRHPSLDMLSAICMLLGASTDYLFDLSPVNISLLHLSAQELFILTNLHTVSRDDLDLIVRIIRESLPR